MPVQFPDGFLWGTATAGYQVEGAVAEGGRGLSIWDTFSHTPGKTVHGDTGDVAADQFHRLESDLDLMAELGYQAYRFSVAWPRIQPEGHGPANEAGLDYYRRLVDGLNRRGITPMLTLYHWDLPQALQDAGGWPARDTAARFAEYAELVYRALGDAVPLWITLNEPWVAAFTGHEEGRHAPGIADRAAALHAAHHLLFGHGLALEAMRAVCLSGTRLGIALNFDPVRPASDDPADVAAARRMDGYHNRIFLDPLCQGAYPEDVVAMYRTVSDFSFVRDGDLTVIAKPIDFLGVNYYFRNTIVAAADVPILQARARPPEGQTTTMGWRVDPAGLTDLLLRLHRDYTHELPLYITESGTAVADYVDPEGRIRDSERIDYLDRHVRAAHTAIEGGVPLRGYMVWSFLDNFEWAHGYSQRFGLVYVDYRTQTRIPKDSATWYTDVVAHNGLA